MSNKLSDEIRAYPYSAFEDNQREKWADRATALEQRVQELERRLRAVDRATYGAFPEQREALAS